MVDWGGLEAVIEAATRRAPLLAEARVMRAWAGLRTLTPDHHAILGPVPSIKGLYLANGFSGHGFQHAPIVGRVLAEMVLEGAVQSLDVSELSLTRFAEGKAIQEVTLL